MWTPSPSPPGRAWPAPCWSGVAAAKAYALAAGKPLYGVNHLAAHVAVDTLEHGPLPEPAVALLVSGGHSSLLRVDVAGRHGHTARRHHRRRRGRGVRQGGPAARDAVPGRAADRPRRPRGRASTITFPRGLTGPRDQRRAPVRLLVLRPQDRGGALGRGAAAGRRAGAGERRGGELPGGGLRRADRKAVDACREHGIDTLVIGGGVAANSRLRALAEERCATAGHRAARPPAAAVHRQRGDGRGAGRPPGRRRRRAEPPRPAGRLSDARHRHHRVACICERAKPRASTATAREASRCRDRADVGGAGARGGVRRVPGVGLRQGGAGDRGGPAARDERRSPHRPPGGGDLPWHRDPLDLPDPPSNLVARSPHVWDFTQVTR